METVRSLLDRRLIVVTGKGGVGKTAVACAVAEAARQAGKRVLLVETARQEAVAARFEKDPRPVGHAGRELAPGLRALRIDPHEALAEYVGLQLKLAVLTDRILRSEIFTQLLEAAPGWRELIVLGKIWHLEQRSDRAGRPLHDLIVVDAPATGHGLTFLDVPRVARQAVRAGPLARHAGWVEALIHDPERTVLLPVTLPEELPVLETAELVRRAREQVGIAVDRIVVNQMPGSDAARARRALDLITEPVRLAALPEPASMRALLEHAARRAAEAQAFRREVAHACALPVVDLQLIAGGFLAESGWTGEAGRVLAPPVWPDPATDAKHRPGLA
ncbi:ArsA family ATPase [Myxococcota bacterium]|nr:ArsA family ATPase [Myxococcota bacterium]